MTETTVTLAPFSAEELSMQFDAEHWFPFVENEDANITGYGHQDKAEFAAGVNRYDEVSTGEVMDGQVWTASDIAHKYAVRLSEERCYAVLAGGVIVGPETPGSFPITTLWGQR